MDNSVESSYFQHMRNVCQYYEGDHIWYFVSRSNEHARCLGCGLDRFLTYTEQLWIGSGLLI